MAIAEFKELLASFLNRPEVAFTQDDEGNAGVDKLLAAANWSKQFIQRRIKFEYARKSVDLTISATTGGDLTAAVIHGGATAVKIRDVEQVYLTNEFGAKYPLNIVDRNSLITTMRKGLDRGRLNRNESGDPVFSNEDPYYYQQGQTAFLYPDPTTDTAVVLDVLEWLLPYADTAVAGTSVEDDFLLNFCEDYMLLKSVQYLNMFLKEDQRVAISKAMMEEAYESVLDWNATLVGQGDMM